MAVNSEHAVVILSGMFENGANKKDSTTLIAGVDGQRIPIHRVVLMTNSKYFTASLGTNFKEADENEFILDEIDGPTLKAIVDFCYTGRIDLTEENVSKYLAIASGVELRLLEQKCFGFLSDKLNKNTAVATLFIAEKFNCQELRRKAFDLICELFDELPPSHIDGLDSRLLKEILENDAVHAEEQLMFDRVLSWYRKNQDERGQHMTELLRLIRLLLIPSQYLNGGTMQMIYKEFDCLEYFNAESKRRIACPNSNAGIRRRHSIYCLSRKSEDGARYNYSEVKFERYISALNEFEAVGEIDLGRRSHSGAIVHGNKVYILGGYSNLVVQKSVSVFDLTSREERVLPEMASNRYVFASILVGKFIYVIGGCEAPGKHLRSCERFDLETKTWKTLKPMNVARTNAAVAVLIGCICVAGGYNKQSDSLNDFELFDPQNNEWITLTPMNDARTHCNLFTSKNYLYAIGTESSIERYDPLTTRWRKVYSFGSFDNIASSVEANDNIYVIKNNGEFGEIKFGGIGSCSFIPIAKSKFSTNYRGCHYLFRK